MPDTLTGNTRNIRVEEGLFIEESSAKLTARMKSYTQICGSLQ